MTQNCLAKLFLALRQLAVLYHRTTHYRKITTMNGTAINLQLSLQMGLTILNQSTLQRKGEEHIFKLKNSHECYFHSVVLDNDLNQIVQKFSEHYHDAWSSRKLENGWTYGDNWSFEKKSHPRLKPYNMLGDYERERYKEPVRESLKALLAMGWSVEHAELDVSPTSRGSLRRSSKSQVQISHSVEFFTFQVTSNIEDFDIKDFYLIS